VKALLYGILLSALSLPAHAQSREVIGYAGVLGEWELAGTVTPVESSATGEFSGSLTMTHVGICTQDGPERKAGEIRFRIASARLDAKLSIEGVECAYTAALSDAYAGRMDCPGRPAVPLKLWVR
jgi:hypothetical protein